MHLEIERKFLVAGEFRDQAYNCTHIQQGYISSSGGRTVRVRIRDDKGYLTIKGPSGKEAEMGRGQGAAPAGRGVSSRGRLRAPTRRT